MHAIQTQHEPRDVIAEMMTENTGRHFLDSGGAYGRNWERNQGRDFATEPYAFVRFERYGDGDWYVDAALNVYHWLHERLQYDADLQARFDTFAESRDEREPWLSIMEAYADTIEGAGGLYGDDSGPMSINSYNGDDMLSQVIQWVGWEIDGDAFVLLQIHGGCDIRGGYTAPRAFQVTGMSSDGLAELLDSDRMSLCAFPDDYDEPVFPGFPHPEPAHWDNYGGAWECDDAPRALDDYTATDDPAKRGQGFVYIDEDGNGYCPITGGKLQA